jgi:hypothetical protein
MKHLVTETTELISRYRDQLDASQATAGGVVIDSRDGAVVVIGAEGDSEKTIFSTTFVSDEYEDILDARVSVQDLLESEGFEVISAVDLEIALEELLS